MGTVCKNYVDPNKSKSRYLTTIEPILTLVKGGEVPAGKIILAAAGRYPDGFENTECGEYVKAGIIKSPRQFLGVDNCSCIKSGKKIIDIEGDNIRRYGPQTKCHIPFIKGDFFNVAKRERNRVFFFNLDLQGRFDKVFREFIDVVVMMEDHSNFGISFNCVLSSLHDVATSVNSKEYYENGMIRLFDSGIDDISPSLAHMFNLKEHIEKNYTLFRRFAYDGTGNSACTMGTYVFWKGDISGVKGNIAARKAWETRKGKCRQ